VLSLETSVDAVAKRLLLQQYAQRIEGRIGVHQGPAYYLLTVLRDFGPLWLLALGWLAPRRERREAASLAVWALAAPVLATASASKLAWYAYLSYPGIALLLAAGAQAVSNRRAVLAASVLALAVLGAWLPVREVWPAQAEYRGLPGRLWEIASQDPEIEVVPGPDFKFLRQSSDADRESRLFLRMLFRRGAAGPDPCRVTLVNRLPPGTEPEDALELYRPARRGPRIWLIDGCNGWLVERLGSHAG
jgi:hypothetical protein